MSLTANDLGTGQELLGMAAEAVMIQLLLLLLVLEARVLLCLCLLGALKQNLLQDGICKWIGPRICSAVLDFVIFYSYSVISCQY